MVRVARLGVRAHALALEAEQVRRDPANKEGMGGRLLTLRLFSHIPSFLIPCCSTSGPGHGTYAAKLQTWSFPFASLRLLNLQERGQTSLSRCHFDWMIDADDLIVREEQTTKGKKLFS